MSLPQVFKLQTVYNFLDQWLLNFMSFLELLDPWELEKVNSTPLIIIIPNHLWGKPSQLSSKIGY